MTFIQWLIVCVCVLIRAILDDAPQNGVPNKPLGSLFWSTFKVASCYSREIGTVKWRPNFVRTLVVSQVESLADCRWIPTICATFSIRPMIYSNAWTLISPPVGSPEHRQTGRHRRLISPLVRQSCDRFHAHPPHHHRHQFLSHPHNPPTRRPMTHRPATHPATGERDSRIWALKCCSNI